MSKLIVCDYCKKSINEDDKSVSRKDWVNREFKHPYWTNHFCSVM